MSVVGKVRQSAMKLVKTPIVIARSVRRSIARVLSKLQLLPLDTVSGKLLALTQLVFVTILLVAALYAIALWRGLETVTVLPGVSLTLSTAETALFSLFVGFGFCFVAFSIAYLLDSVGLIRSVLVQSGIRQRNRISPGILTVLIGFVSAGLLTYPIGNRAYASVDGLRSPFALELDPWIVAVVFVVSFVALTGLVHWLVNRRLRNSVRFDLSVVDVVEHDDGTKSLSIRNGGDERFELELAKIEDSTGRYYTLESDLSLRPGETCSLVLPSTFVVQTIAQGGFSPFESSAGEKSPTIYARSGELFAIEWSDENPE